MAWWRAWARAYKQTYIYVAGMARDVSRSEETQSSDDETCQSGGSKKNGELVAGRVLLYIEIVRCWGVCKPCEAGTSAGKGTPGSGRPTKKRPSSELGACVFSPSLYLCLALSLTLSDLSNPIPA